ncbi:MAG: HU family DNA-binding protein [Prolixibacteraceae bacterium]|jgi:predicted histone-like DNA-binding protein
MTIKYKVVKKTQVGVIGGGTVKYHAAATGRKMVKTRDISRMLAARSTLSSADVKAVLTGLAELLPELLLDGSSIHFEDIGIFSTTLVTKAKDAPNEVNESSIDGLRIKFRADNWMKRQMRDGSFKRVKS